jgi:hypothetical protein
MTLAQFRQSIAAQSVPAKLSSALQALWLDARGDWEQAHACVQEEKGRAGSWVHAYLHRKEGDLGNAGYWYARAGRPIAGGSLDDEWTAIAEELLAAGSGSGDASGR